MASLTERPGKSGISYTVRWRERGTQQRKTFHRKKEAEAWQRKAEDIEEAHRLGRPLASPTQALRRTFAQEWPRFIERRTAEVGPSTVDKHEWVYRVWIEPVLANRKLGTIAPEDLRRLLEDAKVAGKGVDTRIAIYQAVNMLLDNALGRDGHRCRTDVTVGTATRERDINVLTDRELDRLIVATPQAHRLLVDFLATMGARPHEALGASRPRRQRRLRHPDLEEEPGAGQQRASAAAAAPVPVHAAGRTHRRTGNATRPCGSANTAMRRTAIVGPRRAPRLIVGLIPEATGPMTNEMRRSLDERQSLIERRAHALTETALTDQTAWTRALGAAPRAPRRRDAWIRHVRTIVAYRDRYQITSDTPLGPPPGTTTQRIDAARARGALRRARILSGADRPSAQPQEILRTPTSRSHGPSL